MGRTYTREKILQMCQEALEDVSLFYTKDFVNYRGKVAEEDIYYTEIIAEFVLENITKFKNIQPISRGDFGKTYNLNHIGDNVSNTNRIEEKTAIKIFKQSQNGIALDYIGKIVDYQTPLKSSEKDKAGKIDLLAQTGDSVYILELKKEDSNETMLRCVLEGYTYLCTVNQKQLFNDFNITDAKFLYAAPLVYRGGAQWKEMQEPEKHQKLIELIKELNVKGPFYLVEDTVYSVLTN